MRSYPTDSPRAAARILALATIVDGDLAPAELQALARTGVLQDIDIDFETFQDLLGDLCEDMLIDAAGRRDVELDPEAIDAMLAEVRDPALRRRLLAAMSRIADADGVLADAEATLLAHAAAAWSGERLPAAA
ncbi:TerB family tellurite resistance protein [Pseudoduganella chitinolytica]|uniref:TerB family tellurite resistance protein n=1 Tax=Pseudoduganella chitinolytica TaxID=34070 RepID=A0ABY8B9Y7_9BURK|nr:TerB family tellurite resistance protein [Pseudoduganella chitinolytica]WEF32705.1 TerB family tellurite resistance protein [Pseudoduganella chitinolytica]